MRTVRVEDAPAGIRSVPKMSKNQPGPSRWENSRFQPGVVLENDAKCRSMNTKTTLTDKASEGPWFEIVSLQFTGWPGLIGFGDAAKEADRFGGCAADFAGAISNTARRQHASSHGLTLISLYSVRLLFVVLVVFVIFYLPG